MVLFQSVAGDAPKQTEKPTKAISPGTFFGMGPKLAKPKTATVGPVRVKAVTQCIETPKKQILMPFQVTPKRQERPRLLLQLKFGVSILSKPDINVGPGKLIPSEAELMSMKSVENADDLCSRYLQGYWDKSMGGDHFLNPTETSKIAANMAMKLMGEWVATQVTLEKSFDKDEWMSGLIDQVKSLRDCGKQNHAKGCTCQTKCKRPKK